MNHHYKPLYQIISQCLYRSIFSTNPDTVEDAENMLDRIEREILPSGSGFDSGTKIDRKCKQPLRTFKLETSYHHMDDAGFYDGWTSHVVTVTADMTGTGPEIGISGRDKNMIKDYIGDTFGCLLFERYHMETLMRYREPVPAPAPVEYQCGPCGAAFQMKEDDGQSPPEYCPACGSPCIQRVIK